MNQHHPAVIHGRSFALIQHALRGDLDAVKIVAAEPLGERLTACAQIVSLVEVCALLLARVPEQERERLLQDCAVALAQAEADDVG